MLLLYHSKQYLATILSRLCAFLFATFFLRFDMLGYVVVMNIIHFFFALTTLRLSLAPVRDQVSGHTI